MRGKQPPAHFLARTVGKCAMTDNQWLTAGWLMAGG
jgi:hypothetical protein